MLFDHVSPQVVISLDHDAAHGANTSILRDVVGRVFCEARMSGADMAIHVLLRVELLRAGYAWICEPGRARDMRIVFFVLVLASSHRSVTQPAKTRGKLATYCSSVGRGNHSPQPSCGHWTGDEGFLEGAFFGLKEDLDAEDLCLCCVDAEWRDDGPATVISSSYSFGLK